MGKIQYYTINKFECCGCPACTSSCPVDAIHCSVRDNGVIRKLAAYIILGINMDGKKKS